ncbi:hypothetical protein [Acetobacter malorum]|uniref:Uncharacterized protein n=2 Tax=Acetobacter malorum TaxID=178901 RepID=A0A087PLD8_9PROT|nr:hypothetical protein [Acetobacter malorum]KFL88191.1 hypothetical protein AmDm5_2193 [Acetobacter malorum]KXV10819.1 hypothetical protein AD930_00935 [Acetobacter malorum]KXV69906.1 hypothetical protein AD951_04535 [Acetobacter malorum]KXV77166.1 hypothetical protein AD953_04790 [Acetobacter malorum]GBQ82541.1 hypothetical protein AA14337_2374 [Acetobacter malorum DSM 14337]
MPDKRHPPTAAGSLGRTLLKTLCTVALTALLIALLREGLSLLPWVDRKTGQHAGSAVLQVLAADGNASQQQMIAAGLMVLCFLLAIVLVRWGEGLLDRSR